MKATINFRHLFVMAAFGTTLSALTSSCKKDDPAPTPVSNTITDKVVADANFSTLEAAVVKAGLVETLKGAGPFTVFAPDNAAFTASNITSLDPLSATALQKILLYHTVAARALAADLPTAVNTPFATANGTTDSLYITKDSRGVFINGIQVTEANITADNGVIHKIGRVLLPPPGNMVATASANLGGDNGLDSLVNAIVRADGTSAPGLINLINSNVLTVFAPTNKAFRDLLTALRVSNINQIPTATLAAVLSYHVKAGRAFSSDLANGSLGMFAGGNTTVNLTNGTGGVPTILGNGNSGDKSNIIATNIVATKGVVHVIDRVLLP